MIKLFFSKRIYLLVLLVPFLLFVNAIKTSSEVVIIDINDSGFFPREVSIKQGDRIRFVNNGLYAHWPASNIHPTHGIYPEFDPQKSLMPQEIWEFKFEKSGNWRFHDHDWLTLTGLIKVSPVAGFGPRLNIDKFKDFFQAKRSFLYYKFHPEELEKELASSKVSSLARFNQPKLTLMIQFLGPKKVVEKLLNETNYGSNADCHQPSHQIGRIAYEVFKSDAFKKAGSYCQSGYLHGALEAFFHDKGTDNLAKKVSDLCDNFSTDFSRYECLHGVGHGVLALESYDLPRAIETCKSLKDDYSAQSCFGGLFMENILTAAGLGAGGMGHQTFWVSDDPYFPCNKIDQDVWVQHQCYLMQTSRMMQISKHDFGQAALWCADAPEALRDTCFQSLGRDAAGFSLNNPQRINEICLKTPKQYYPRCLLGGLNVIMDFWDENFTSQPKELCQVVEPSEKEFCYESIGNRLFQFFGTNKEKIKSICALSEKDSINTCLKAAGIIES